MYLTYKLKNKESKYFFNLIGPMLVFHNAFHFLLHCLFCSSSFNRYMWIIKLTAFALSLIVLLDKMLLLKLFYKLVQCPVHSV